MLYIIKNISNEKIAVGKLVLQPNMEVKSKNIEPFKTMIEQGYLKIINRDNLKETNTKESISEETVKKEVVKEKDNIKETTIKETTIKETNIKEDNFKEIDKSIKIDMVNCLFNFYTEKNLTQEELNKIKKLYKQELIDKCLIDKNLLNSYNNEIFDLIDCAETYEDLVAVLLNNVYFELLEIYTNN